MRDFFHGWRRKLGCVTLMMACISMSGWLWTLEMPERQIAGEVLYGFTVNLTFISAYLILWKPQKDAAKHNNQKVNS